MTDSERYLTGYTGATAGWFPVRYNFKYDFRFTVTPKPYELVVEYISGYGIKITQPKPLRIRLQKDGR